MLKQFMAEVRDTSHGADARLQHARYTFEGYRDQMTGLAERRGCPYSPGSPRACSWEFGVKMAMEDAA